MSPLYISDLGDFSTQSVITSIMFVGNECTPAPKCFNTAGDYILYAADDNGE